MNKDIYIKELNIGDDFLIEGSNTIYTVVAKHRGSGSTAITYKFRNNPTMKSWALVRPSLTRVTLIGA